jgi:hypothetical protein
MDENEAQALSRVKQALRQGHKATAEKLLVELVTHHPRSETAWLWLSALTDDRQRERECLEKVLALDPDNALAWNHRVRLDQMEALRPRRVAAAIIACPYCAAPIYPTTKVCGHCGRNTRTGVLLLARDARRALLRPGPWLMGTGAFGLVLGAILSWGQALAAAGGRVSVLLSGSTGLVLLLASLLCKGMPKRCYAIGGVALGLVAALGILWQALGAGSVFAAAGLGPGLYLGAFGATLAIVGGLLRAFAS